MNIRIATFAAMLGICAIFLLRTVATFIPQLFASPAMAKAGVGFHLFSTAAMLWFFVAFFLEMTSPSRPALRQATALAAAGAATALLLPLQTLLRVMGVAPYSMFVRSPWLEPIAPLIASVAILIFFAVYRRELISAEKPRLQRATGAAMAAYALFTVLNLIVISLYWSSGQLRWLTQMGPGVALLTLPIVAAGVAAVLGFFTALSKYLAQRSKPIAQNLNTRVL